ncbi:hypothetical protein Phi19:2_gp040 [Cellulophaga phage phi19:2]|uniref:Uncharacterized protein n=3 Tax=Cellulophaga phage phiST TaxID=756282 RepID=M4SNA7_9CAUD|nr:hypothetical protein CGPG_00067 [Cellulophaga phage phiST]AGH56765.1 hypothetical protein CGPG_00067 [Cellulophaga phage phiST]AGO47179.1 hypothetical protein PhiST_gp040 [Cellulophaga phage phiST]AGO48675.1 hypothetical protein Phi19:2_gp040 [Cellulophaga phage phi19:2]AGO49045.1 hypothetical protein Phi13:1_gp034 [Cellulophaga phage phi13:1]
MSVKKVVGITTKVEGFHNFPTAVEMFGKKVEFLSLNHRHLFGINLEIPVEHNERDKEFILLKREVEEFIEQRWGRPAQFEGLSCESIAEELMIQFKATMVKVDEDGENYAKITKQ